jgi:chorismate synthase
VVAGGIAEGVLHLRGIRVVAHASCIGGVHAPEIRYEKLNSEDLKKLKDRIAGSRVRCHDRRASELMEKVILQVKKGKDSIGGTVSCAIIGVPGGIGDPFFDTIEGEISKWMFSIPGIKSVAFGSGSECPAMRGSEFNDPFEVKNGRIITSTNHSGGVLGGITTGMPIVFHVNVRPTSSIGIPQKSVNLNTKSPAIIRITGRHDPCIVPRAVPVVEACASLCILDTLLSAGYKFTGE